MFARPGCHALLDGAVELLCFNSPKLLRLGLSLCSALRAPRVRGVRLEKVDLAHCEALERPHAGPHGHRVGAVVGAVTAARHATPGRV